MTSADLHRPERSGRGSITEAEVDDALARQRRWIRAFAAAAAIGVVGYVVVARGLYPTLALAVTAALAVGAWLLFRRTAAHRDGPARRRAGVRTYLALRRYADPGEPYRAVVAVSARRTLSTSGWQVLVLVLVLAGPGVRLATADGSAVLDAGLLTAGALLLALHFRVRRDARRWLAEPPDDAADSTT